MNLLSVNASPRSDRSLSRRLSKVFWDEWSSVSPDDLIVSRDIGKNPPPHLTEEWIGAAFTAPESRSAEQNEVLQISNEMIEEVLQAGIIVVASPMYNYGMPSHLKAWIDQVIRINRTFTFDLARGEQPIEPVQSGKTLVILMSSGEGYFSKGDLNAHRNHLDTHLQEALRLVGVSTVHTVRIEFQEFGDDRHQKSVEAAHQKTRQLARQIANTL
ncbi:FMN-dependent NADH-azoreductase 1 [Polystyrenella longa]|uniref:FMN dependent NADH:quinone oxidoreductase n=1 Tax=Polystyrenella longa TaxID=2528007 RepID=A0A518CTU9_9PLAN|nr:NAD(P)H-dependent oxidoreductase [Polystyrenella longa]QDU82604.1 FMN-dependent NADH-azoreductase 1 [Polystyrenella longa]